MDKEQIKAYREELNKVPKPNEVTKLQEEKTMQTQLELMKKEYDDYKFGSPLRLKLCRSRHLNTTLNSFTSNLQNVLTTEIGNQLHRQQDETCFGGNNKGDASASSPDT